MNKVDIACNKKKNYIMQLYCVANKQVPIHMSSISTYPFVV